MIENVCELQSTVRYQVTMVVSPKKGQSTKRLYSIFGCWSHLPHFKDKTSAQKQQQAKSYNKRTKHYCDISCSTMGGHLQILVSISTHSDSSGYSFINTVQGKSTHVKTRQHPAKQWDEGSDFTAHTKGDLRRAQVTLRPSRGCKALSDAPVRISSSLLTGNQRGLQDQDGLLKWVKLIMASSHFPRTNAK